MGKRINISEIDDVLSFDTRDKNERALFARKSVEADENPCPSGILDDSQYRMMFTCASTDALSAAKPLSQRKDLPPAK